MLSQNSQAFFNLSEDKMNVAFEKAAQNILKCGRSPVVSS